jgi:hypothetical protein
LFEANLRVALERTVALMTPLVTLILGLVVGTIQGAMFLLIFRYVFGGAIDGGAVPYVDFLVPGLLGMSLMGGGLWGVVAPRDPIPDYKLKMGASIGRLGKLSTWWRPMAGG